MNKRIISFFAVLFMVFALTFPTAYAQPEDILVYAQDFEQLVDSKGNGLTGDNIKKRDTTFTNVGTNATSKTTVAVITPEQDQGRVIEDFNKISAWSENSALSLTDPASTTAATVENQTLKLDKQKTGPTAADSVILSVKDLKPYLRTLQAYTVELDLKSLFINEGMTVQLTLGADFEFRQVKGQGNQCTVGWYNNGWVNQDGKTDPTTYDLSDFQHITLAVREDKTVDLYVGPKGEERLAAANVPQRGSNLFTTLKLTLGRSLTTTAYVDNIMVSAALPEETLMTEDFNGRAELPVDKGFSLADTEPSAAALAVTDGVLRLSKTETGKGSPIFKLNFKDWIKNLTSYSVQFDLRPAIKNSTLVVYLGGGIAIRNAGDTNVGIPEAERPAQEDNKYVLEWYDSTIDSETGKAKGWNAEDKTIYDLSDFAAFRMAVKAGPSVDVYLGEKKVVSDLKQRDKRSFTELQLELGNSMTGELSLDNFALTRGDTAYQPPVPAESSGNHVMRVQKLASGGSETRMNLEPYLCGAEEYTYSFSLQPDLAAGSFNVFLGAGIQFVRTAQGNYNVLYHPGGANDGNSFVKAVEERSLAEPAKISVRVKKGGKADFYMDNQLIQADVPGRNNYSFKQAVISLNGSVLGAIFFDDFTLTLNGAEPAGTTADANAANLDFSEFTPGVLKNGTGGFVTSNTPATGLVSIAQADESHGRALCMYSPISGEQSVFAVSRNYRQLVENALVYSTEFDLLLSGEQSYNIAEKSSGGGGFKLNFDLSLGNSIKYQSLVPDPENGGQKWEWVTSDLTFAPDTWFTVKYEVDTKAGTADVYIDGQPLITDLPSFEGSPWGGLYVATNKGTLGKLWLDNFSMTVDQSAAKDSFISGRMEAGRLALSAYVSDEVPGAKAFVAYYSNETLTDVVVLDCTPGQELKRTLDIPEQNLSEIRLMLWSDMMPLCADVPVPLSQS